MDRANEKLCRLCLKLSEESINLFHYKDGHLIADLVKIICPIVIDKSETTLPLQICQECLELVIDAIHLRDLSLLNDQELRKNAKESEIAVKDEDVGFYLEALDEATLDGDDCESFEYSIISSEKEIELAPKEDDMKNYCEFCSQNFANSSSFKRHQLRKHTDVKYHCDRCNAEFKTKHDTEKHMKKFHITKYPNVKFLYSENLSTDVTDMYEKLEEPMKLACSFCAYTDFEQDPLMEHLRTHQDVVDSGKMYCIHCPSQILTMDFLIAHTKQHNEKMKTHRCLMCNKTFPYDEKFLTHLRNHKKNQHKICFCPECGRKFSKPRMMEDHIRFIHHNEALFCCPECGQGFGSKSALNGHIKRHVEGNKYSCPFCPKTFASHNLLTSHKVVHSTDRVRFKPTKIY